MYKTMKLYFFLNTIDNIFKSGKIKRLNKINTKFKCWHLYIKSYTQAIE